MTLQNPDAQAPKSVSPYTRSTFLTHSTPTNTSLPATPPLTATPKPPTITDSTRPASGEHKSLSSDFSHSWDLATGGLKTLTAKREFPSLQKRRAVATLPSEHAPTAGYMFLLVILACIVVMLISGGIVLFMTLQL